MPRRAASRAKVAGLGSRVDSAQAVIRLRQAPPESGLEATLIKRGSRIDVQSIVRVADCAWAQRRVGWFPNSTRLRFFG